MTSPLPQPYKPEVLKCTVYIGRFIHCLSLTELEICEEGAIGVDEQGKIAFVERDVRGERVEDVENVVERFGWGGCEVVRVKGEGFFFPGFIGMRFCLFPAHFVVRYWKMALKRVETATIVDCVF